MYGVGGGTASLGYGQQNFNSNTLINDNLQLIGNNISVIILKFIKYINDKNIFSKIKSNDLKK